MMAGWSTQMLDEMAGRRVCEDAEDMAQWRSISQGCIDGLWKGFCDTMEKVLERYKVDEAKKRVLLKDVVRR